MTRKINEKKINGRHIITCEWDDRYVLGIQGRNGQSIRYYEFWKKNGASEQDAVDMFNKCVAALENNDLSMLTKKTIIK